MENPKYKIVNYGNKVIAISSFAGKRVRGIAKCAPNDNFDMNTGRTLAIFRCNVKIAKKRAERAESKRKEAEDKLFEAARYYRKMQDYLDNANVKLQKAIESLEEVEKNLK